MKKIAVVILNWNGKKLLEQFLPSVAQYSKEANIYIADNGSTDDSVDFIKTNFPSITIVQNNQNLGFAQGYNAALQHIDADIFALINSDIEVTENWLKPIREAFENPKIAIIQPKILDFKNKEYFEYAGAAGGFIDKYGYPFCRGRIFKTVEKDFHQYDDNRQIFWASGACFFIRSKVYHELQGFDADFFAHQEEIDLCWRAFNSGHQIEYVGNTFVYHVGGATLSQSNPHKTFLNFRNSLFMLTKNLPQKSLYKILFIRILLDGLAGIQFILHGKFSHCIAIVKAHWAFYTMFSKTLKKRQRFQKADYFDTNNIVSAYFLKKYKTYSSL